MNIKNKVFYFSMARRIRLIKPLHKSKIMKIRRSEKSAELLEEAWKAFQGKQTAKGLRLLYSATSVYKARFNAILLELNAAKSKGMLPRNFQMPKNASELKKLI